MTVGKECGVALTIYGPLIILWVKLWVKEECAILNNSYWEFFYF